MTMTHQPLPDPADDPSQDPALAAAVLELEAHVDAEGWDAPARLYALADTAQLARREPLLAEMMGLDPNAPSGWLTPIEQDALPVGKSLESVLADITWPDDVAGVAAVVERIVLPPDADAQIPDDAAAAATYAAKHPQRQEVRIIAGVTRAGASYCALRLRGRPEGESLVDGTELVPGLITLLHQTFDLGETTEAHAH